MADTHTHRSYKMEQCKKKSTITSVSYTWYIIITIIRLLLFLLLMQVLCMILCVRVLVWACAGVVIVRERWIAFVLFSFVILKLFHGAYITFTRFARPVSLFALYIVVYYLLLSLPAQHHTYFKVNASYERTILIVLKYSCAVIV